MYSNYEKERQMKKILIVLSLLSVFILMTPKEIFALLHDSDNVEISFEVGEDRRHTDVFFQFKKVWTGLGEDEIAPQFSWQFFRDGENCSHIITLRKDGWYRADDLRDGEYWLVEIPPPGWIPVYHNVGDYRDITDRLYSGGTLENIRLPNTGDRSLCPVYIGIVALVFIKLCAIKWQKGKK